MTREDSDHLTFFVRERCPSSVTSMQIAEAQIWGPLADLQLPPYSTLVL